MEQLVVPSFDGTRLAVTIMGEGRPVLLLHGLFSNADMNWVRYGAAQKLVDAGFRLILPDLRGHGASDAPADPAAYPPDVLARDVEALVDALGLGHDLVLGGYSLGARTTARVLVRGQVRPRAAILSGMGLQGLNRGEARGAWFIRMIEGRGSWVRGQPEFMAEAFMKAHVKNPDALIHLLKVQVNTSVEALQKLDLPVAIICGHDDQDNGQATELATILPHARLIEIPGNHMSAVTTPAFGRALVDALSAWS
jgi:pimeloyl-ACP methyl ester carboxylesterase